MDYKDVIRQFERYQESGWSKSEVPNSACLVIALDALNRARQLEAEAAAMREAIMALLGYLPAARGAVGLCLNCGKSCQGSVKTGYCPECTDRLAKQALLSTAGKAMLERVQGFETVTATAIGGIDHILGWLLNEANPDSRRYATDCARDLLDELQQGLSALEGGSDDAND